MKTRFSLKAKSILLILMIALVLSSTAIYISYQVYATTMDSRYRTTAMDLAKTAAALSDSAKVKQYADEIMTDSIGNLIVLKKGSGAPEGKRIMLAAHMDEIGFMESKAEVFCKAILKLLDGHIPVIAAVKDKNTPFLNQVKSHPNCRVFYIREDNRNELFEEVLTFLQNQL
jgi:hypothetical protein